MNAPHLPEMTTPLGATTTMRWTKALAATATLLGLLAAVPALLIAYVGNPWPPEGVALMAPLSDNAVIGILAVACWLLWAQLVVCVAIETVNIARDRRSDISVPGVFEFQRQLAHVLVTSIALSIASAPTFAAMNPPPAAAAPAQPAPMIPQSDHSDIGGNAQQNHKTANSVGDTSEGKRTVVVQRGDTVWDLAEKHLGAGERYVEIARLNEGKPMSDGSVFRTADLLVPGWELALPADTTITEAGDEDEQVDHVVRRGDTLSQIALDELGDADRYPEIFEASQQLDQPVLLTDPDLIYPGQKLDIPGMEPTAPPADAPPVADDENSTPSPTESTTDEPPTIPQQLDASAAEAPAISPRTDARGEPESSHTEAHADDGLPSWVLPGLASGGVLLAGSMLLVLRHRRAAQHRHRRPGFVLADPPPSAMGAAKSITVAGDTTAGTVELIDQVLRRLARNLTASGTTLPSVAAVEVTDTAIAVHLRQPAPAPTPWTASEDQLLWVVDRDTDLDLLGDDPGDDPAPWPLLVTVGHDERGSTWLLNLEGANVTVTGDPQHGADLARYLAAEIACNPWSKRTVLDLVGVATELQPISPDRIHLHDNPRTAAIAAVTDAVATVDRLSVTGDADAPAARARNTDLDPWPSRLLIIEHGDTPAELDQLLSLIADHRSRAGTAVVLIGRDDIAGMEIHVDDRCRLTIASVNLTVTAVGLTSDEARGCAALLAHADEPADMPAPDLEGDQPWRSLVTTTGALRDQYRVDRSTSTIEPAAAVLNEPDDSYTGIAATTRADLNALAPNVTDRVRQQVLDVDPELDDDLQTWTDDTTTRPRLTLLGPVGARACGAPIAKRKPFYTELLAYLTTRPHGATPDEVAAAFDLSVARARTDVGLLREWLGVDPATGEKYLPDARNAPATSERGIGVYQVFGVLTDLDLFRRLRVRGESRGPDGITDLVHALNLVTGRPFDKLRRGGWGWLLEGDRLDQHATCAVADVAHVVVTDSLSKSDVTSARTAADVAMLAAPDEEVCRLDLAAVLDADGHSAEAEKVVLDDVCNRSDDGEAPTELPARTEAIFDAREWLQKKTI